jgi:hypothetical protein
MLSLTELDLLLLEYCIGRKRYWRRWKASKELNQADYSGYPIMGGSSFVAHSIDRRCFSEYYAPTLYSAI